MKVPRKLSLMAILLSKINFSDQVSCVSSFFVHYVYRVGRFTVAALESQIDKQKREIDSLHKALSLSDNRIEKLQSQITAVTTTSHKGVYHK